MVGLDFNGWRYATTKIAMKIIGDQDWIIFAFNGTWLVIRTYHEVRWYGESAEFFPHTNPRPEKFYWLVVVIDLPAADCNRQQQMLPLLLLHCEDSRDTNQKAPSTCPNRIRIFLI